MSELEEPEGMTEREALNALLVTQLQIRDWVALIAKSQSPDASGRLEELHRQKKLLLDLPEYEYEESVMDFGNE